MMSDEPFVPRRTSIFDVGTLFLAHAALWAPVALALLVVPWFGRFARDCNIMLPWMTQEVLDLPRGLLLLGIPILLAFDLAFLILLNRRGWRTILAVLWSTAMALVPLICTLSLAAALWLPLEKVRETMEIRQDSDPELKDARTRSGRRDEMNRLLEGLSR